MPAVPGDERREFQRLRLDPPVPATLGTTAVSLLDVGVLGARVHHAAPFEQQYFELRFSHGPNEIGLRCEVIRTYDSQHAKYPGTGLESGLRFLAAVGDSGDHLRSMLGELVKALLEQRPMTPTGTFHQVDGDKTVRGTQAGFVCYRLENAAWRRRAVFLPEQPQSGFTVASSEDRAEMQRLCAVYAASDEEGRRLIRLFAELSVSEVMEIPPRA
ncbi:MAG TPA: hypothetical protein VGR02_16930 [Thermoanaerobaculia bacterium]|jgi:hypothetical protein|nr:hypothetical protein [Thermoanaerobaculia bacterium]